MRTVPPGRRPVEPGGAWTYPLVLLRGERLVAVLDQHANIYIEREVRHLPTLFTDCGRSLVLTVADALGRLLP